jgi:hypothetical protein
MYWPLHSIEPSPLHSRVQGLPFVFAYNPPLARAVRSSCYVSTAYWPLHSIEPSPLHSRVQGLPFVFAYNPPLARAVRSSCYVSTAYLPLHSADDTPAKFTRAPGETSSTRYRWRPLLVGSSTRRRVIWDTICNQVIILRITNTPTTSMPFEKSLVLTHNRELPRSIE